MLYLCDLFHLFFRTNRMMAIFLQLHPILQALLATTFTWGVTALGAAGVFLDP
jgi:hypothetical protein